MSNEARTTISSGDLAGIREGGIDRFLGIPYAAPPVREGRFALPLPHPAWTGVRDASVLGATAPQAPYGGGLETLLPTVQVPGDDYLAANVWSPVGASGLPVMVWVHGGALSRGSTALGGYDGSTFARDGIVFVSLSYRLGTEGFSVLEGAPLNLGLADVIAGVQWVRDEVAAFGGDPEQITLFGQSAGGNLIAAFLAHEGHPAVKRAIIQSAPLTARPAKDAGRITRLIAKDLRIPTTREAFAAVVPVDLVDAQQRVTAGTTPITGGPGFALAIGGDLIPDDPEIELARGAADEVDLMIGATSEEYRLWFVPSGLLDRISPLLLFAARLKFRIPNRVVAAYRRNHPRANAGTMLGLLATDLLLRLPLNRLADDRLARGRATWVYDFVWPSPVMGLGAAHAVELGFVFDLLRHPDSIGLAGDSAPQQLADDMHGAWVRFAKTGDPGWESWSAKRPVQTFSAPASAVVYAPREDERSAWPR